VVKIDKFVIKIVVNGTCASIVFMWLTAKERKKNAEIVVIGTSQSDSWEDLIDSRWKRQEVEGLIDRRWKV